MRLRSLRLRILLIVVFAIGFWVLLLGLLVGAALLPYLEVRFLGRLHLVALLAPVSVLALIWGARPRRRKFTAPGPELLKEDHPALFAAIERVAAGVNEPMPTQVFLVPDVNAYVSSVGGFMGIGSRRIMGIGLAAMQVLNEEELVAVLAHEFGHYAGGDTHFGSVAFGLVRSMQGSLSTGRGTLASVVVESYHFFFMRIASSVIREQERQADQLASSITSPEAIASALYRVEKGAEVHNLFLENAVKPMLQVNRLPPLTGGFTLALLGEAGTTVMASDVAPEPETNFLDSHPPLLERLTLLGFGPSFRPSPRGLESSAIRLLKNVERHEAMLWKDLIGDVDELQTMAWSEASSIRLEEWRNQVQQRHSDLFGLTLSTLPRTADAWSDLGRVALGNDAGAVGHANWSAFGYRPVAEAMTVQLVDNGWTMDQSIFDGAVLRRGHTVLRPFQLVGEIVGDNEAHRRFDQLMAAEGLSRIPLVGASTGLPAVTASLLEGHAPSSTSTARERTPVVAAAENGLVLPEWSVAALRDRKGLTLTSEAISIGQRTIALCDVTDFGFRAQNANGALSIEVRLNKTTKDGLNVRCSGRKNSTKATIQDELGQILNFFRLHIEPRLFAECRDELVATGKLTVASIEFDENGWRAKGEYPKKTHSWAEYAGTSIEEGTVVIWQNGGSKPKQKKAVLLSTPNAILLPELLKFAATHVVRVPAGVAIG